MDLCLSKHLKSLRAEVLKLHIQRDSFRYITLPTWGSHLQWERCYSGGSSLIRYQPIFLVFQSPASAWSSTLGVVPKENPEKKQCQDTWQERRCWDSPQSFCLLYHVDFLFFFVLFCFDVLFVCLLYSLFFPKAIHCDGLICLFTAYTVFKCLNITYGQLIFFQ